MAKEVNYTEDQVLEMKEMYVAESTSETVQEIATKCDCEAFSRRRICRQAACY